MSSKLLVESSEYSSCCKALLMRHFMLFCPTLPKENLALYLGLFSEILDNFNRIYSEVQSGAITDINSPEL